MTFNKNDVLLNINKIFISIKDSSWQLTKPSYLNFSKTEGLKISPLEIKNNNQPTLIYKPKICLNPFLSSNQFNKQIIIGIIHNFK